MEIIVRLDYVLINFFNMSIVNSFKCLEIKSNIFKL